MHEQMGNVSRDENPKNIPIRNATNQKHVTKIKKTFINRLNADKNS